MVFSRPLYPVDTYIVTIMLKAIGSVNWNSCNGTDLYNVIIYHPSFFGGEGVADMVHRKREDRVILTGLLLLFYQTL